MPRYVRPVWVDVRADGRTSTVGIGPAKRDGKLSANVYIRDKGSVSPAFSIFAGGLGTGDKAKVEITADRDARLWINGAEINVPKGSILYVATDQ